MEVDADGSITVNGKPVSRILVNGKEFFGNDPKVATKNLPKEIIDKIQVVDTKTKTEEFTGKAGNPDDKTINITIKEDKNRGYFTRATAGGGTDDRYELSGIGNYFKDDLRVSVLASSNNINSYGFSFDEVFDMMGRRARSVSFNSNGSFSLNGNSFGGSGGITKSETAGFNFTNEWGEKYELNADYFFGRNDTKSKNVVEREYFRPENNFYRNSTSTGNNFSDSHRANASFEIELDTLTKLSFRPSVRKNEGISQRSSLTETLDEDRQLTNNSSTFSNEEINSTNFSNRINFIRKFGGNGAYLQAYLKNNNDKQEGENQFKSEITDFETGNRNVQDQIIEEDNKKDEYRLGFTQRSVLTEKLYLDLSYDYSTERSNNERSVFDFNDTAGNYTTFNETLSNSFEINSHKHRPNVGLNYEGSKWRAGLGIGYLNTSLASEDFISGTSFERNFENLYINTNLRFEIKRGSSLYVYYRNDTDIPSIRQMQPVVDETDPLNIVVGNPMLSPTFRHNVNLGFRNFDFATRSGFSVYASATINENQVVPSTTTDENYVRTTTYENVDGEFSSNVGSYLNKRYKNEGVEFSYRLGTHASYGRQVGFSNGGKFNTNRLGVGPSVRLGFNYKELVDINPRYQLNYVQSKYDNNINRKEEYSNHTLGLEATTYWPQNWVFGNDLSYNYFGSVAPGFDPTSFLWNMSLGYKFLNDDASLKFKIYDLLNENVSTSRTTGQDFVQDSQELILEQYFMVSFTYKLSKFGGKDPNRRGGGIRRF